MRGLPSQGNLGDLKAAMPMLQRNELLAHYTSLRGGFRRRTLRLADVQQRAQFGAIGGLRHATAIGPKPLKADALWQKRPSSYGSEG